MTLSKFGINLDVTSGDHGGERAGGHIPQYFWWGDIISNVHHQIIGGINKTNIGLYVVNTFLNRKHIIISYS